MKERLIRYLLSLLKVTNINCKKGYHDFYITKNYAMNNWIEEWECSHCDVKYWKNKII